MAAEHAYLYVVGTTDGPTKIGYSMAPANRLKAYQREGRKAFLAGQWPVGRRIALTAERYVHWQLREHHIRGEWFNVTQETAAKAIEAALAKSAEFDPEQRIPSLDIHGSHSRLPAGTLDRIDLALDQGANEKRSDFIRDAIERELKRRQRKT